jgi:hypothetical protein
MPPKSDNDQPRIMICATDGWVRVRSRACKALRANKGAQHLRFSNTYTHAARTRTGAHERLNSCHPKM